MPNIPTLTLEEMQGKKVALVYCISIVAFVFLVGTGIASAAEERVGLLPDSPFYFVKTFFEALKAWPKIISHAAYVQYQLELAERRIEEAEVLAEQGKADLAERLIERSQEFMERADRIARTSPNYRELKKLIQETRATHLGKIQQIGRRLPREAQDEVRRIAESIRQDLLIQEPPAFSPAPTPRVEISPPASPALTPAVSPRPELRPSPSPAPSPSVLLAPQALGEKAVVEVKNPEDIVFLQTALKHLGYFDDAVTGDYTPQTEISVQKLQAAKGLPQTGKFDTRTQEALQVGLKNVSRLAVPDRILVKMKPGLAVATANGVFQQYGLQEYITPSEEVLKKIGWTLVRIPETAQLEKIVEKLRASGAVEEAATDFFVPPAFIPVDSEYTFQWHHPKIGSPLAWNWNATRGTSMYENGLPVVAIADTGVQLDHPDLKKNLTSGGYDFWNYDQDPSDDYGHGTIVAGVAGAVGNNSDYVAGVAFNIKMLPIKVAGNQGWATFSKMAQGIIWAADRGAKVVNLSFRACDATSFFKDAVAYLYERGGVVVIAAGNDGAYYAWPEWGAICVSATTLDDVRASFSNAGPFVNIAAPGTSIHTTKLVGSAYGTGRTGSFSGTSLSAPIVSGALGLILLTHPYVINVGPCPITYTQCPDPILKILFETADDLGAPGRDPVYGYGRVNVQKAVDFAWKWANGFRTDANPPSIPEPLGMNITPSRTVSLHWNTSNDTAGVAEYQVFRRQPGADPPQLITRIDSNQSTYEDTSVSPGNTYTYSVKAVDVYGNQSAPSNVVTVLIPVIPSPSPTPSPTAMPSPIPVGVCRVTGCSGEICADQDIVSLCAWKSEYVCYRTAKCERQSDEKCGWTMTSELNACLNQYTNQDVLL